LCGGYEGYGGYLEPGVKEKIKTPIVYVFESSERVGEYGGYGKYGGYVGYGAYGEYRE